VESSLTALRFNGNTEVSIPPAAYVLSDPVAFDIDQLTDFVVSLYIAQAPAQITAHLLALRTNYIIPGNHAADVSLAD
jgi:hypothetical protein